jgi:hypothetical protein
MQKLIVYKTSDGKIHENINDAEKYADNRYGNALKSLAYQLVRGIDLKKPIERYNAIVDFLEAHLAEFVEVQKLKDDIKIVKEDEYEDGN